MVSTVTIHSDGEVVLTAKLQGEKVQLTGHTGMVAGLMHDGVKIYALDTRYAEKIAAEWGVKEKPKLGSYDVDSGIWFLLGLFIQYERGSRMWAEAK